MSDTEKSLITPEKKSMFKQALPFAASGVTVGIIVVICIILLIVVPEDKEEPANKYQHIIGSSLVSALILGICAYPVTKYIILRN